jgi:hypothetical protein
MSDNANPFAPANEDPFKYDDAAYVLGALAADERAAFEGHLLECDECVTRVHEVAGVPALLRDVTVPDVLAADERAPDTLLPRMMREASRRRRRSRTLIGALGAVAAACAITLVVVLWPSSSSTPAGREFTALVPTPIAADAVLTSKAWGTSIDLNCRYIREGVDHTWSYDLVVYDRAGNKHVVGDWKVPPEKDISYTTGTSLDRDQISRLVITLPDGTPVMRLAT